MQLMNVIGLDYKIISEMTRKTDDSYVIKVCYGQRFIGVGMSNKNITILGILGDALGAYLNDAVITVNANAQGAVGDTMNKGRATIYGSVSNAAGYAMRGGKTYARSNADYRAGIHIKVYKRKIPVMIIGGSAGNFLGEYRAREITIVLGPNSKIEHIVGHSPYTGMHGGKIYLRGNYNTVNLPKQAAVRVATSDDMKETEEYLCEYYLDLRQDLETILSASFIIITLNSKNPYKQMYAIN